MNKENIISLSDYQNLKKTSGQNKKYETLLGTLSVTEICSEINTLLEELKSMMGIQKKDAQQGKMILRELENRCTTEVGSSQIHHILSQFEKEISSLEK